MKKVILFVIVGLFLANTAWGHEAGQIIIKEVGEYKLDFEYEALTLTANEAVRLNFAIYNNNPNKPTPEYNNMWVRIIQIDGGGGFDPTVFSGAIHKADFGSTGITTVIPRPGAYEVAVRFSNADKTLVETSFEVTVAQGARKIDTALFAGYSLPGVIVGIIIGAILVTFFKKRSVPIG